MLVFSRVNAPHMVPPYRDFIDVRLALDLVQFKSPKLTAEIEEIFPLTRDEEVAWGGKFHTKKVGTLLVRLQSIVSYGVCDRENQTCLLEGSPHGIFV